MQDEIDVHGSADPVAAPWSAAVLDVLRATGLVPRPICLQGRSLLVRIVQMHTRLCLRLKA